MRCSKPCPLQTALIVVYITAIESQAGQLPIGITEKTQVPPLGRDAFIMVRIENAPPPQAHIFEQLAPG